MGAASTTRAVIGIDFDNTTIRYDAVMYRTALEYGWIVPCTPAHKIRIRHSVRSLPFGEQKWRHLQALVYGPKISEAQVMPDVKIFLKNCRESGNEIYIISHKTDFATADEQKQYNLKTSALGWLEDCGFFSGGCVDRENVFFESSRKEKVKRIETMGCTQFVDDLEMVFLESGFPKNTMKILFDPHRLGSQGKDVISVASWKAINRMFFPNGCSTHGK